MNETSVITFEGLHQANLKISVLGLSLIPDTVGCGANFTEPSGTLFHSSDLGRECTWTITTDDLHSVQLTYELSNITQSFDCSDGFVQVIRSNYSFGQAINISVFIT